MRAVYSMVSYVSASMTRTPEALPEVGSYMTECTTLMGRSVSRPVSSAAGNVAACELK